VNTVLHRPCVISWLFLMSVDIVSVDDVGLVVQVHALSKLIAQLVHIVLRLASVACGLGPIWGISLVRVGHFLLLLVLKY